MFSHRNFHCIVLLALASSALGCAPPGSAPRIVDLAATPTTVTVGASSNVDVTITYEDPDGDVERVEGTLSAPGVASAAIGPVFVDTMGAEHGDGMVRVMLVLPIAGDYALELELVDALGNRSAPASVTITAIP